MAARGASPSRSTTSNMANHVQQIDTDSVQRYERKLRVTRQERQWVDLLIHNHPANLVVPFPPRYVNNLYLDTVCYAHYFDHLNGVPSRRKLRFRWYGDLLGGEIRPQFEIKEKQGWVMFKNTYDLPVTTLPRLTDPGTWPELIADCPHRDQIFQLIAPLQPTLVNRYRRDYYRTYDGSVRVTVDTEMSFYRPDRSIGFHLETYSDPAIVVEIKFDDRAVDQARSVSNHLPLPLNKNSKYINGIHMLHGIGL
jgi:hypothetical protein